MPTESIKVNGTPLHASLGRAVSFISKRSSRTLAGINIDIRANGLDSSEMLEGIFNQEIVSIYDPFVSCTYQATIQNVYHSYSNGNTAQHHCEIRELDVIPEFNILEIEGDEFAVLNYTENDLREDDVVMFVLLRLSQDRFAQLQSLFKHEPAHIRRIGVDAKPITVTYGGSLYWSKHEEDGAIYYKHIVTLIPVGSPVESMTNSLGAAIQTSQTPFINMVLALSARFEALLDELTSHDLISSEKRGELLGENWVELLDQVRIEEIKSLTRRIDDAEVIFATW
jgi:hypothetical protein